jgi:hypothetical protein
MEAHEAARSGVELRRTRHGLFQRNCHKEKQEGGVDMKRFFSAKIAIAAVAGAALGLSAVGPASAAEKPQKGGILNFVVGSKIPSYDGHRETTFGVIHPSA